MSVVPDIPVPALLRFARGAYIEGIKRRLDEAGLGDLPRNGPFIVGGMANRGATLAELTEDLGVSKQAASQLVDTLVSRGYLERQAVQGDRRKMTVALTARGARAGAAVSQGINDIDALLAQAVSPQQVEGLRAGLWQLGLIARRLGALEDSSRSAVALDEHEPPVVARLNRRAFERQGAGRLGLHLADHYGVEVAEVGQLDAGVFLARLGDGQRWVTRIMPAERPLAWAQGDAAVLALVADAGFPAERLATDEAVSELEGQAVVVTRYSEPVPSRARRDGVVAAGGLARLGELLAEVQALGDAQPGKARARGRAGPAPAPSLPNRLGGGWHILVDGGPAAEVAAAVDLVQASAPAHDGPGHGAWHVHERVLADLAALDVGDGLPLALGHPDFVMANMVVSKEHGLVVVDWAGAGLCPRIWPLAFFLWSVGAQDPTRVDRAVDGYRRRAELTPAELERLPAVVAARPTVLKAWELGLGRRSPAQVAQDLDEVRSLAGAIGERAVRAFEQ